MALPHDNGLTIEADAAAKDVLDKVKPGLPLFHLPYGDCIC